MGLAFVRWWLTLLGGAMIGAGLVLHGQVQMAHYSREQVQNTFFLWRGIGQLTFAFQGERTQLALWFNEIPERALVESERGAWTLVVIGVILAVTSVFIRSHKARRR